jgi:hypothetical protein
MFLRNKDWAEVVKTNHDLSLNQSYWTRFRDGAPEAKLTGNLVEAYHRLLMNPDPAIHEKAARDLAVYCT